MAQAVSNKKVDLLEPLPSQVLKARADLTKVLGKKLNGKPTIQEHIVKIIDTIVHSCPDKALERFEEISYLIKHSD